MSRVSRMSRMRVRMRVRMRITMRFIRCYEADCRLYIVYKQEYGMQYEQMMRVSGRDCER